MQNPVNDDCRYPSPDDVDDVVGLDIDGGEAHQDVEWHHTPEEPLAAQSPGEKHQDGRYAYMAAGEGCRRPLACCMGILHDLIEESVVPAWHRQRLLVGGEIVAQIGKDTCRDALDAHCLIVVLGTSDRQEDEDDVVDEERHEDHEHRTVELLVTEEKGEQRHQSYQRIVGGIA